MEEDVLLKLKLLIKIDYKKIYLKELLKKDNEIG